MKFWEIKKLFCSKRSNCSRSNLYTSTPKKQSKRMNENGPNRLLKVKILENQSEF